MNKIAMGLLVAAFAWSPALAPAKPLTRTITITDTGTTTTTTGTENGVPTTHIHRSDGPAVGDPMGGSGVSEKADRGPANTQRYCPEGSTDPDCVRAEKRQTSDTTWQEDCTSGATKACSK